MALVVIKIGRRQESGTGVSPVMFGTEETGRDRPIFCYVHPFYLIAAKITLFPGKDSTIPGRSYQQTSNLCRVASCIKTALFESREPLTLHKRPIGDRHFLSSTLYSHH
jgi:hypothetical protein